VDGADGVCIEAIGAASTKATTQALIRSRS
jgi:hypothetical protein